MAIELRGTIALSDITAVEFRCSCGYASTRKLDNLLEVPPSCGNGKCRSQVIDGALQRFLREVASYAEKDGPYSLRLYVQGLEGTTQKARQAPIP